MGSQIYHAIDTSHEKNTSRFFVTIFGFRDELNLLLRAQTVFILFLR